MSKRVIALSSVILAIAALGLTQIDTNSLLGKPAPDIKLSTIGKTKTTTKLSALKGNVVLIDYWATWCPPCRESLPHINEIAADKDLAAKGLKVFALNSKEKLPIVQKFIDDNNYTFPVALDLTGEFSKLYKVRGIPTTVIIGRDGTIKSVFVGFDESEVPKMKKAIADALAEEAPKSEVPPAPKDPSQPAPGK